MTDSLGIASLPYDGECGAVRVKVSSADAVRNERDHAPRDDEGIKLGVL